MTGMPIAAVVPGLTLGLLLLLSPTRAYGREPGEHLGNVESYARNGMSIIFTTGEGERLRVTPYGDYIVRIQAVRKGEEFFPDNHYEMLEPKRWSGKLGLSRQEGRYILETAAQDGISLSISQKPLLLKFSGRRKANLLLEENAGVGWEGTRISESFTCDSSEHFTGMGHTYLGRSQSIDLRGTRVERNYGTQHGQQAPLIVPFYLSSKGYGVFLNSTFENRFDFDRDGSYGFSIDGHGFSSRMDFFLILGPEFSRILDRYTQLTGRPRFPPRAIFGLGLSDKANDENSPSPSDESWWKQKVKQHREAGFPIDHLINDNRWRAGGGKRCESYLEWDRGRFPHPAEYEKWINENGLITTIDFNRCIASRSEGWKPEFNLPDTKGIEFGESAPDFTRKDVRQWIWGLFWKKSLDPSLGYPGDALWMDEFDELGAAPDTMILGNGRSWAEMKNYWFFLIAQSLVQEGWDQSADSMRRPFVWIRGMTAGAQRYATLWSGDILPTFDDMKAQIRSMQLAGMSGFPYWGHDAGGFFDWTSGKGPSDTLYLKWSMAFGSFSPFWKPHGMGQSRWPLDRPAEIQDKSRVYCRLRYELMPYTYTYAYQACATGMPTARAMVIADQNNPLAWQHDLQYFWGDELLVAPETSGDQSTSVWLPGGHWYDFWSDSLYDGSQVINYPAAAETLPLFVREGAIIPMADFALSTAFINPEKLTVRVYVGHDGAFDSYEDDGVTGLYKQKNQKRWTGMSYSDSNRTLVIRPSRGSFRGAAARRSYRIEFHGMDRRHEVEVNGKTTPSFDSAAAASASMGAYWDETGHTLSVFTKSESVRNKLRVRIL